MKPNLKILHTADIHLGARFVGLGEKGAEQRRCLRDVLQEITHLALTSRVEAVLVAGDLFDNLSPSPESLAAVEQALSALSAGDIPLVAIAGTHDGLEKNRVWEQLVPAHPGRLILLTPEAPAWKNSSGSLVVQGVSLQNAGSPARPLADLRRTPDPGWQVGVAHASLEIGQGSANEARFSPAEVEATDLDYLALGHWHGLRDCSQGRVTAWYSGPPEMIALDEAQAGQCLLVTLEEGRRPQVAPQRVGRRTLLTLTLEAAQLETLPERARSLADPNAVLELTLQGLLPAQAFIPLPELQKSLAAYFFHVRIKDQSVNEFSPRELERYPETTAIGRFVRLLLQEIERAEGQRRQDLQQALHLGLAMLQGREVRLWS